MITTLKAEKRMARLALALALLLALVSLFGCAPTPSASPTRSQVETRLPGYRLSDHALERMAERGVTVDTVADVVEHGERFYDPKNDSHIRWKDGVYVPLTDDGVIKTVIRGKIELRWKRE